MDTGNYDRRGTSPATQIIFLEARVKELEAALTSNIKFIKNDVLKEVRRLRKELRIAQEIRRVLEGELRKDLRALRDYFEGLKTSDFALRTGLVALLSLLKEG
jgi:hypothetical protein